METFKVSDGNGGQYDFTKNPDGSYDIVGTSGETFKVLFPSKLVLNTQTDPPQPANDRNFLLIDAAIKTYENKSKSVPDQNRGIGEGFGPGGGIGGSNLNEIPRSETPNNLDSYILNSPSKSLIYPLESGGQFNRNLDYFKLTAYEYTPDSSIVQDVNFLSSRIEDRATTALGTIYLPMQPSEDRSSVGYGPSGINQLQKIATQFFGETAKNPENILQNFKNALGKSGKAAESITANDIVAYFGGKSVGADLFTRATGKILNNNLELLFNGPELRTFSYNYVFNPRSEEESKTIRSMFKWLKKNMLAKNEGLFLKSPNFFKPEYKTFDSEGLIDHPFLNKIGYSFLTGLNINYIPDNSYMTYSNKSMTSYNLQLELTEINPIYSNAINLENDVMDF